MRALLLALAFALLTPGCALLRGEGEETLVVRNADVQPVSVILRIDTADGQIPVFAQEVFLDVGQRRDFAVAFPAGRYVVYLTATNQLSEILPLEIPERGDSEIEIVVGRGRGSVTVREL